MDEKLVDEILNNLISEAGPIAIEELEKEDLKNLDKKELEFSKEHEEKMAKFFEEFDKENVKNMKKEKSYSSKASTSRKILLVAVITVLMLAAAISSVSAWRESFVKYFLGQKEEYSDLKVVNKNLNRDGKDFWTEDGIYFGYIPDGYELKTHKEIKERTFFGFESEKDLFINFEINSGRVLHKFNTESGDIEEIIIANKDMIYSENDTSKILTWNENNNVYALSTNDSKNVLVKVVENVKLTEK